MRVAQIRETVEQFAKVNLKDKSRRYDLIKYRFLYCYYSYYYSTEVVTYRKIGDEINRAHCSVIYAIKEYPNILKSDTSFRREVEIFDKLFWKKHQDIVNQEELSPIDNNGVVQLQIKSIDRKIRKLKAKRKQLIKNYSIL